MEQTLNQFASPAKRRKTCFIEEESTGVFSGFGLAATPSRDARGSNSATPKSHKSFLQAEPCTPGTSVKSSTEDGLLCISPEPLPPNLMLLNQLLGALYVTIPLLKSRGKPTTYQNLQKPVQNFCGRDFEIHHIQQIKALSPQALSWQHILITNPSTKQQEQQLLITMPRSGGDSQKSIDTVTLQQEFFQRLQQQRGLASNVQLPQAQLPPAAAPNARDCTPTRRSINPQMLPGTPQTAPAAASLSRTGDESATSSKAHLMMSPPPKRAAMTISRSGAAGAASLMSPPPARTRAGRARQPEAEPSRGFTFSPVPRPRPLSSASQSLADLASNIHGSSDSHTSSHPNDDSSSTPVKDLGTAIAAAAATKDQVKTPVLRPNKLFATPAFTGTPQQVSAARPGRVPATPSTPATPAVDRPEQELGAKAAVAGVPAAAGVKVRRLTFDVVKATTAGKAQVKAKAASSGIDFELGESTMALLKHVTSSELQEEEAVQQQELDALRALDMVQGSFDVLRAIFGDKGPCVKPKGEVLLLMRQKSTFKSGMSPAEAAEQLDLLTRMVPDMIRSVTSSGQSLAGLTPSIRINRQMTWSAARQKLMRAVAEARSGGIAAAAMAVAEDQQQQQEEVAEAAQGRSAPGLCPATEGDLRQLAVEASAAAAVFKCSKHVAAPLADHSATVDDVLAQLVQKDTSAGSSSSTTPGRAAALAELGSDGLTDEARALLSDFGAGSTAAGGKQQVAGGMSAAVMNCLAFKALPVKVGQVL